MSDPLDLIVVGGGPAGCQAALEADSLCLRTILIHDEALGGLLRAARRLEAFPGQPERPSGLVLAGWLAAALYSSQLRLVASKVVSVSMTQGVTTPRRETGGQPGAHFEVRMASGETAVARALILATGTRPVSFHVPDWISRLDPRPRLHRDMRSLPMDLSRQRVVVVGGGEAAMDSALHATDRGAEVTLLVRGSVLKGRPALVLEALRRLDVRFQSLLDLSFAPNLTHCNHLLVCIGRAPQTELRDSLLEPASGHPESEPPAASVLTRIPGLFQCGDMIGRPQRYALLAAADGALAAHLAKEHLS